FLSSLPPLPTPFPYTTLFRSKTNGTPIIHCRGFGLPERGGHYLERIILHHLADHLLESFHLERGKMLVHSWHFVPQRQEWTSILDRKSTRLNSSHVSISYAVF